MKKKRNRKKLLIIILIIILGLVLATIGVVKYLESNLNELETMEIAEVDLTSIADGYYEGRSQVFPVEVEVGVTVVDHQITDIKILKHENGKGENAEAITESVIAAQSLQVDSVTGATYSSKVILKAIEDALITGAD